MKLDDVLKRIAFTMAAVYFVVFCVSLWLIMVWGLYHLVKFILFTPGAWS